MNKQEKIQTGKVINKLDKEIEKLKKEIQRQKAYQSRRGIKELKETIEYHEEFIIALKELIKRYF